MRTVAVFFFLLVAIDFASAQPLPTRQKSFPAMSFNYLDGQGYTASIVSNFTITLIERMQKDGRLITTYVVDYDIYNRTWGRLQYGIAAVGLVALSFPWPGLGSNILQNSIRVPLDRASCTYGGARHVHISGGVIPNYLDIAWRLDLSTDRVSGPQGQC